MIDDIDLQRSSKVLQFVCGANIVSARSAITGRMIMRQQDTASIERHGTPEQRCDTQGHIAPAAFSECIVTNEALLRIAEYRVQPLLRCSGKEPAQITEKRRISGINPLPAQFVAARGIDHVPGRDQVLRST